MSLGHFSFSSASNDSVRTALKTLYGENRFAFRKNDRRTRVAINGHSAGGVTVIRAHFSMAFRLSLEGLTSADGGLAIFLRSAGNAKVRTAERTVECDQGRWIPFASGAALEIEAPDSLTDTAVIIAPSIVNAACHAYLGSRPDAILRFDPSPFAPSLAAKWTQVLAALDALAAVEDCPDNSFAGVAEHGLSFLLKHHAHNYSSFGPQNARSDRTANAVPIKASSVVPALTTSQVEELRAYINVSLDGQLTVPKLASLVGMGTTRFASAFRRAFGMSPGHYVRDQRIRRAMWLLENGTATIATIAAEAGFSGQSHLVARMRALVGVTPREYRLSMRQLEKDLDPL